MNLGNHPRVPGLPRHVVHRSMPRGLHLRVRGTGLGPVPEPALHQPRQVHRLPGVRACLPLGGAPARHRGAPCVRRRHRSETRPSSNTRTSSGWPGTLKAPADYQRRRRQQAQVGLGRLKVRSRRGRRPPASAQRSSGARAPSPRHLGRRPVTTGRPGRWSGSASPVARDDRRSRAPLRRKRHTLRSHTSGRPPCAANHRLERGRALPDRVGRGAKCAKSRRAYQDSQ